MTSNYKSFDDKKLSLKSIDGRKCLSKCYPKNFPYLHPILLTKIMNPNENSCAINPTFSTKPGYFKSQGMLLVDRCSLEDNQTHHLPNELDSILLSFYFNPRDFLESIYKLQSFDEVITWTRENNHLPFNTIKRVHNCAWRAFVDTAEGLTNNIIEFYYQIAIENWLRHYVNVIETEYSFDIITKNPTEKTNAEIYKILASKFLTYSFFTKNLKKYIYEFKDQWDTIDSHYGNIKNYIFTKLIETIQGDI